MFWLDLLPSVGVVVFVFLLLVWIFSLLGWEHVLKVYFSTRQEAALFEPVQPTPTRRTTCSGLQEV